MFVIFVVFLNLLYCLSIQVCKQEMVRVHFSVMGMHNFFLQKYQNILHKQPRRHKRLEHTLQVHRKNIKKFNTIRIPFDAFGHFLLLACTGPPLCSCCDFFLFLPFATSICVPSLHQWVLFAYLGTLLCQLQTLSSAVICMILACNYTIQQ